VTWKSGPGLLFAETRGTICGEDAGLKVDVSKTAKVEAMRGYSDIQRRTCNSSVARQVLLERMQRDVGGRCVVVGGVNSRLGAIDRWFMIGSDRRKHLVHLNTSSKSQHSLNKNRFSIPSMSRHFLCVSRKLRRRLRVFSLNRPLHGHMFKTTSGSSFRLYLASFWTHKGLSVIATR
jgi:hypothetical protein